MGTLVKTSFTQRTPQYVGQHREFVGTLALSSSYATGGDTISAAVLGLQKILSVSLGSAGGYTFQPIIAADGHSFLVKAFDQKDPANAGGADIPGPEVANAVDLHTISVFARVIGY